jgi:hypothetical protein
MLAYGNGSVGAWVYLALHGTYGVLWLLKERIFPDRQWQQAIELPQAIVLFLMLGLYWLAPWLLIASGAVPPLPLLAGAIAINLLGVFLHFASDAQKHFVLKVQPGLIEDGFFARCRNTNYLGEVLIYLSFAMVAMHWLPNRQATTPPLPNSTTCAAANRGNAASPWPCASPHPPAPACATTPAWLPKSPKSSGGCLPRSGGDGAERRQQGD